MPEQRSFTTCQSVYRLVCQKPGITRDPTGYVHPDIEGERQAAHLYKEIIHQHRDWSVEQIDEELVQRIFNIKSRGRIFAAFHWVKGRLERIIDAQPESVFTLTEKAQIKARLRKIQLQIPPPASLYKDEPDIFTRNEVFYERISNGKMRLRVGGAYIFVAKSWFNLVFTVAHELSHSIDPCEIRAAHLSFPAYDRLEACFLQNKLIVLSRKRSECGENDQLSEVFADWLAVQVTVQALELYSTEFDKTQILRAARNSVRDLCEQESDSMELDTDFHPDPHIRIEMIFGRNPQIRHLLGCSPPDNGAMYCNFQSDPYSHPTTPTQRNLWHRYSHFGS